MGNPGSFMRVDIIPADMAADDEAPKVSTEKYLQDKQGTVEVTADGQVHDLGPRQVNSSDFKSGSPDEKIMSTARTQHGSPIGDNTQLNSDSIVTVDGVEMRLGQAVQLGLVSHDNNGYRDSGKTAEEVVRPPEQPKVNTEDILACDTEGQAAEYRKAIEAHLGKESAYGVINSVIQHMTGERTDGSKVPLDSQIDGAVKAISRETGADPSTAREMTLEIYNGILNGGASWINSNYEGVRGYDVIKWAQMSLPGDLKASYLRHMYLGHTDSIRELVDRYRKGNRSS